MRRGGTTVFISAMFLNAEYAKERRGRLQSGFRPVAIKAMVFTTEKNEEIEKS
jgi:hypothetical protein